MRKNKKANRRDARLSVVPTSSQRVQKKKSQFADDKEKMHEVASMVGRKGYVEQCKAAGIFIQVCALVRKYRTENQDSSAMDVYKMLHEHYKGFIFDKDPKDMYGSNFMKTIQQEPALCNAFYCNKDELKEIARQRVYEVITKEIIDDSVALKAYDVIMKYEQDDKETEADNFDMNVTLNFGKRSGDDEICILK